MFRDGFFICADCQVPLVDTLVSPPLSDTTEKISEPEPANSEVFPNDTQTSLPIPEGDPEVIFQAESVMEANMAIGFLQSNGIAAFLFDTVIGDVKPLMTRAMGGVRVAVASSQAQLARELLKQQGAIDIPPPSPEEPSHNQEPSPEKNLVCSHCRNINLPDANFCDECGKELK